MRCPNCNYDAGNRTVCPNCGKQIMPRSSDPTTIIQPARVTVPSKRMERIEKYLIVIMILLFGIFVLEAIQTGILLF